MLEKHAPHLQCIGNASYVPSSERGLKADCASSGGSNRFPLNLIRPVAGRELAAAARRPWKGVGA
jgi:hypothetical protein